MEEKVKKAKSADRKSVENKRTNSASRFEG